MTLPLSRRELIRMTLAASTAASFSVTRAASPPRVVVVGAGAFGGWTALTLLRQGARVTLVDAWGPGNARASSGGETRVIRSGYGERAVYTRMAARALTLWREHDRTFGRRFYRETGALFLFGSADDPFGRASLEVMRAERVSVEWLTVDEVGRRFPQVGLEGVAAGLYEPQAGYLLARRACEHVVECIEAEGGRYRPGAVDKVVVEGGPLRRLALTDGTLLEADVFVFALGPWLGKMFPDVVGDLVVPTRQESFYFGSPAGDTRFLEDALPVWIDVGRRVVYGLPGNAHRGFKVADDTTGPAFDPTDGDRVNTAEGLRRVRDFLRIRFPALADAPVLGGEVCQYEMSPDSHLLVDRHPGAPNVWLVGGGSGHGFKMGPALGEHMAACVLDRSAPEPAFSLDRERKAASAWILHDTHSS